MGIEKVNTKAYAFLISFSLEFLFCIGPVTCRLRNHQKSMTTFLYIFFFFFSFRFKMVCFNGVDRYFMVAMDDVE